MFCGGMTGGGVLAPICLSWLLIETFLSNSDFGDGLVFIELILCGYPSYVYEELKKLFY